MSGEAPLDPVLQELLSTIRSMRSAKPTRTKHLKQRLDRFIGMMPKFPDHFIYVYNYSEGKVVYAWGFEQVLGYLDNKVDLELIIGIWHPDDAPILARLNRSVIETMATIRHPEDIFEISLTLDYRVRKANGQYIKMLRQTGVLEIDPGSGQVVSTFSLCKDISTIKSSNVIGWQVRGLDEYGLDLSSLMDLKTEIHYRPSAREMDVVRKLAEGKSSKVIADELKISMHTVNAHRRNLLERSGLKNTAELVSRVVELGWL